MLLFISKRLVAGLITLVVASFVIYGALYLVPGDPVANLLGGMQVTPELVESVRKQYRLDDPFLVRYWEWIAGVVRGDFGLSLRFRQDVGSLIMSRMLTTVLLVSMASLLIVIGGIVLGAWAAVKRGVIDRIVVNVTAIVAAIPVFITALALIYVFAVGLGWFPASGSGRDLLDRIYHLILPAVALALTYIALVARVSRSSMRRELSSDHVTVAQARGISFGTMFRRHVLRNALPPVFTLAGTVIAGLLVTSQLVEVAFGLNGVGSLLIQSVQANDFAVVQAITMIVISAFVVMNLIVDLIVPLIDPRLRQEGVTP